ncbi:MULTISPECIES: FliH/SctL family protein [Pseudoxanthomonas]|uniref:Flagellar assembly protein FliH n=1 Tax=Pseudoxanthomonas winnipegensis TaxID=2480810 RepID=A0AAW8GGC6_9GAMM|nr:MULTISPECIES: FliH/SctL family protein [Pseudoxanthomonas]MDQ1120668.1 flagellar biosynthesis/type III secretory pathway protein FliH [Pseudoxanthomonas winnipegensis]MDQ1133891.1 flagellar biosynthesis/type III secretory pathway protein FliH [Pseudoxanthomonas winnipegensis]MDR6139873.1 flagellar biosynthesis/type III secretory pathway protein FliH [Pseudoxanthomonas sp. SORGH_AS_0997]
MIRRITAGESAEVLWLAHGRAPASSGPALSSTLEQLRAQAEKEGYEAGILRAEEEARQALERRTAALETQFDSLRAHLEAEHQARCGELASLIQELGHQCVALRRQAEDAAVRIAYSAIVRLFGQMGDDKALAERFCAAALAEVPERPCVLRINRHMQYTGLTEAGVTIVVDPSLDAGGCEISTAFGAVDVSTHGRLEALREQLIQGVAQTEAK